MTSFVSGLLDLQAVHVHLLPGGYSIALCVAFFNCHALPVITLCRCSNETLQWQGLPAEVPLNSSYFLKCGADC